MAGVALPNLSSEPVLALKQGEPSIKKSYADGVAAHATPPGATVPTGYQTGFDSNHPWPVSLGPDGKPMLGPDGQHLNPYADDPFPKPPPPPQSPEEKE